MKSNYSIKRIKEADYLLVSADFLENRILEKLRKNRFINIALSGGSTPMPILKELSSREIDWFRINFFIVDERCVDPTNDASNYRSLYKNFFQHITSNIYPIFNTNIGALASARDYNKLIQDIELHLIVLGMGKDGHIASLFPGTDAVEEVSKYVVYNEVPQQTYNRITFTYPTLFKSDEIVCLIRGEEKRLLLERLFFKSDTKYPVSKIINKTKKTTWLLEI